MKKNVMMSAIALLNNENSELTKEQVIEEIQKELNKSESRKEAARNARAELVAQVEPLIRSAMQGNGAMTSMEVFKAIEADLPEELEMNSRKIQQILVREMEKSIKVDGTGKKNTYELIG